MRPAKSGHFVCRMRRPAWVVALTVCGLAWGCASGGAGTATPTPPARQHPMLENFPIPNGFESVPERCYVVNVGEFRQGTMEYVGELDPLAIERFYREYMPAAGFTLRAESEIRGTWLMDFDGKSEQSRVRFQRNRNKTTLWVEVTPTSKGGAADRETKPAARTPQP